MAHWQGYRNLRHLETFPPISCYNIDYNNHHEINLAKGTLKGNKSRISPMLCIADL